MTARRESDTHHCPNLLHGVDGAHSLGATLHALQEVNCPGVFRDLLV